MRCNFVLGENFLGETKGCLGCQNVSGRFEKTVSSRIYPFETQVVAVWLCGGDSCGECGWFGSGCGKVCDAESVRDDERTKETIYEPAFQVMAENRMLEVGIC